MEGVRRDLETNFYGPLLVPADDLTRWVKSQLSADSEALYPQLNK